jgi:S-layer protein
VSGVTGAITIDGGKNITVSDNIANNNITIGNTTQPAGTITVTDSKLGTGAIAIDGGTDVTVTASGQTTGTVTIGAVKAASGDVSVSVTGAAYTTSTLNTTFGNIAVTGGKTISVTQKATSDASAAEADTTNATITQGNVKVTADANTTTVTLKQDAAVTAVNAAYTTGGVTETATVKFGTLKKNDSLTVADLTIKALQDMTGAQVAAAFANLAANAARPTNMSGPTTANGDTQSAAAYTVAEYTGSVKDWTSSAASGDTVVFTSTTAVNNVPDLSTTLNNISGKSVAPTVTIMQGQAHNATPAGGVMGIVNGTVTIAGAAKLATVTVDGYAASTGSNGITGGSNAALATINLANGGNFEIDSAASTLALSVNNVNGTVDVQSGTTTLNVTANGSASTTLKSATATAVNLVAGSGKVTGTTAAGGAGGLTAATAINTTGFTGTATFTIANGTVTSYTGGAGFDNVTISNAGTPITKAIDLGDGDDTLTLGGGPVSVPTVTLKGGNGTDTLSIDTASADALDNNTNFAAKLDSFERLLINDSIGSTTINLENLGFTNYVTTSGSGGTLTLTNLANNGTVVLTANAAEGYTINVKGAATNTNDVLNVMMVKNGNLVANTLTASDVETVNLTVNGIGTHTATLKANAATALNISGNAGLTLKLDSTTTNKLATINASGMTNAPWMTAGGLTVDANDIRGAVAMTIIGGAGKDTLKASVGSNAKADVLNGGDGNDLLYAGSNGATLTGGNGNDIFVLTASSGTDGTKQANTYSTVTDFQAGDLLQLQYYDSGASATKDVTSFSKLAAALNPNTAVLDDYVSLALIQAKLGEAVWFMLNGDAYVVVDSGTDTTAPSIFNNGEDLIIKLTGVDLTNASWNSDFATVAL